VTTFARAVCGSALLSLGMLSGHAIANFPEFPPVATLSTLSFYHCAASILVIPLAGFNRRELQLPAAVIHPILGLGLAAHVFFGPAEQI